MLNGHDDEMIAKPKQMIAPNTDTRTFKKKTLLE